MPLYGGGTAGVGSWLRNRDPICQPPGDPVVSLGGFTRRGKF